MVNENKHNENPKPIEEQSLFTAMKNNAYLFISFLATKINQLIVFNQSLTSLSSNIQINSYSIGVSVAGLILVIIIFSILWKKVFRIQKSKDLENQESDNLPKQAFNKRNSSLNKTQGKSRLNFI